MEYYWELEQFDGTVTTIPPNAVERVKTWLANNQPIQLKSAVIPANQVKGFRATSRTFSSQPLLDAAAQAFREPVLNEDGSVICQWVKRSVTQREWSSNYSKIPGYKKLGDDGTHVLMAIFLPVEAIDTYKVQYCTDEESERLNRERRTRN